MATRHSVLSQHQHEAAKLDVLRHAAEEGWSDLASGHFDDVDGESIDDFITDLGVRAAAEAQSAE